MGTEEGTGQHHGSVVKIAASPRDCCVVTAALARVATMAGYQVRPVATMAGHQVRRVVVTPEEVVAGEAAMWRWAPCASQLAEHYLPPLQGWVLV